MSSNGKHRTVFKESVQHLTLLAYLGNTHGTCVKLNAKVIRNPASKIRCSTWKAFRSQLFFFPSPLLGRRGVVSLPAMVGEKCSTKLTAQRMRRGKKSWMINTTAKSLQSIGERGNRVALFSIACRDCTGIVWVYCDIKTQTLTFISGFE